MSKRHRRAIRHMNTIHQWCRLVRRIMTKQDELKGISFSIRPSEKFVRSVRDWRYSVRVISLEPASVAAPAAPAASSRLLPPPL